ncbi:hypothetical protein D7X48_15285 [bacterium D16-50]|nr:hypothetical protein D7X48_15285 [bacterium D16-50]
MVNICKLVEGTKRYFIYGIAVLGQYCYDMITEKYGADIVVGFVQTVPQQGSFCGKRVYDVPQAVKEAKDTDRFLIASAIPEIADAMKANLKEAGISEEAMIDLDEYSFIARYVPDRQVKSLLVWPCIKERNKDLTEKIKWFIPDRIQVLVCCSCKETMSDFRETENVHFINLRDVEKSLKTADYVAVWNVEEMDESLMPYRDKIHIIDPNYYYITEITNYRHIYNSGFSVEEKEQFKEHSSEVFKRMCQEYAHIQKANVFCTGPSIEEIYEKSFVGDFNIICNSMVKDRALLQNIAPCLLAFGDLAFYLSPNGYSRAFYKDLLDTYNKYHYYIVVYDYEVPLIKSHFPMLYDRLIGVECGSAFRFPEEKNICVGNTPNICTLFMLPFASAVCEEIGIAGCTGRSPDESYFWKHNGRAQYLDLMQCVFDAYPSFFRHQDYEGYYEQHCQQMKKLLEYGESLGKKYRNITTSFIPALAERTAEGEGQ